VGVPSATLASGWGLLASGEGTLGEKDYLCTGENVSLEERSEGRSIRNQGPSRILPIKERNEPPGDLVSVQKE